MNLVSKPNAVNPSLEIARQHIELLTGTSESVCHFRLIHDSRKSARNLTGTLAAIWPEIEAAQSEGWGVFVVANEGGPDDTAITSVRAVFVDADDIPMPGKWHCPPSFLVKRSATRWHAYWLVQDLPLDAFKPTQQRLAAYYGTDPAVCNLSRVMRLAGTLHLKDPAAPQMLTIEEVMGRWAGAYEPESVLDGIPTIAVKLAEKRSAAPGVQIDSAENVRRFTLYLDGLVERGDVAIEGQHGDNHTLKVANVGMDLGCSPSKTHHLMLARFNDHCLPPWEADELAVKVSNAAKSRENAIGCDAVKPSAEAFAKIAAANAQPATSRFKPIPESQMDAVPDPQWLVEGVLIDKSSCIVVGESGSFKTFIVADLCFAVATGKKTAFGNVPKRTGPVFYATLEGMADVMKPRRQAWREARGVDGTFPFWAMEAPSIWDGKACAEFIEQIDATGQRPVLLALETFTLLADGKENDTESGAAIKAFCHALMSRYGCTVIVVHHNSDKDGASKTGRGTSSLKGNFDSMLLIEADGPNRTVNVSVLKHRSFAIPTKPWHLQGRPAGPALAFGIITPEEVRAAKLARDPYHPSHVVEALRKLGAVGPTKAVATSILASEFAPTDRFETLGERDAAIKTATNRLNERAALPNADSKALWAYADKASGKWVWSLPE